VAAITSSATTIQTRIQLSPNSVLKDEDGKSVRGRTKNATLMDACSNIASNRLPRVLLKTHVMVIASAMVQMTNTPRGTRWPMKPVPTTDIAYWSVPG